VAPPPLEVARPAPPPPRQPPPPPVPEEEPEPVPDLVEIRSAADFPELGGVVREYAPWRWWIGLAASAAVALVSVPLAIVAFSTQTKWLIAPSMLFNTLAALGVFICGLLAAVSFKRRVEVRERGFVYYTPFGNTPCPWEDVAGTYVVKHNFPTSTELRFDLADGKKVWLSWLIAKQDDLAGHVWAATTPLIRARVEEALESGEEVEFGPFLRASARGMRLFPNGPGREVLRMRWDEVTSVSVGRVQANPGAGGLAGAVLETQLHIKGEGNPAWPIASGNVANFPIFLDVLKERSGVEPKTS
jgi:hypothetical protein